MSSEQFLRDLHAPLKSFRLMAIEEALQHGVGEETLAALRARQNVETDDECLTLLGMAIERIESQGKPPIPDQESGTRVTDGVFERFDRLPPRGRIQFLQQSSREEKRELGSRFPKLLEEEKNPFVAAFLIRNLRDFLTSEQFPGLVPLLASTFLSVRVAALESLAQKAPNLLEERLPGLLTSDDPRVRSLAIQGLARVDFEEAINHIGGLLQEKDPHSRLAGLQNCLLVPFESVVPLLLRFLSDERDPELLEKAGLILTANPSAEVPFKLWEIIEDSEPAKKELLKKILAGCTRSLKVSGMTEARYDEYSRSLQEWIQRRTAQKYVQECIGFVSVEENIPSVEFEASVAKNILRPAVRAAFLEAKGWAISPRAKGWIERILGAEKQPPPPKSGKDSPGNLRELPVEEQIRQIALVSEEEVAKIRPVLEDLLSDPKVPGEVKAAIFRSGKGRKESKWVEVAEKGLSSPDPNLSGGALEFLGEADPERVFPHLGKFLVSPVNRTKITAMKILRRFDPKEAIGKLQVMLCSNNPATSRMALACMVQFDFSSVRELLAKFIMENPAGEHVGTALNLFAANPEKENLYVLFHIGQKVGVPLAPTVQRIASDNRAFLEKAGLIKAGDPQFQEPAFRARLEKSEEKKREPPKPYTYSKLYPAKRGPVDGEQPILERIASFFQQSPKLSYGIILGILAMGGFFAVSSPTPLPVSSGSGPLVSSAQVIQARVLEIRGRFQPLLVEVRGGEKFSLQPPARGFPKLESGEGIEAKVVPFRMGPGGVIVAQVKSLRRAVASEGK